MGSLPEALPVQESAPGEVELLKDLYERMVLVRSFDERMVQMTRQGQIKGPMHVGTGQEAVGVGATAALGVADIVTATHRSHAFYIGRGLDLFGLIAEMSGREAGLCKGRAGHMLIADKAKGMLGGSAIVGHSLLLGVGHGYALKYRKLDGVCLIATGDGAVNSGAFNEALNMIALWGLPVVVLIENNGYGLTVRLDRHVKNRRLYERAASYGLDASPVDGNDVLAVYHAVSVARSQALQGRPTAIEAVTYRATGFSTSDIGGYQDIAAEGATYRDPLEVAEKQLRTGGYETEYFNTTRDEARGAVASIVDRVLESPFPTSLTPLPTPSAGETKENA